MRTRPFDGPAHQRRNGRPESITRRGLRRFDRCGNRQRRVGSTRRRDPLIALVRIAGFEVRLELQRPGPDVPRSIRRLRRQQELQACLIHPMRRRHSGLVQREQRQAGRVGVRRQRRELREAAVGLLERLQIASGAVDRPGIGARPLQPEDLEGMLLRARRLGAQEPLARLGDSGRGVDNIARRDRRPSTHEP